MAYYNPLYKSYKSSDLCNVNIQGNAKLNNTDNLFFIIWNIPSQITCPYATELCKESCYAKKSENLYPDVLPCRENNFDVSRRDDFVDLMIETIERKINHYTKKGKKCVVRIHESGDFYNKAYAIKWLKIATYFLKYDNVVFMAYTKSVRFFVGQTIPSNMVIRFSVWADTKQSEIEIAQGLNLPTYSAAEEHIVNNLVTTGFATKCRCEDCANCGYCWDKTVNRIYCVIH